MKFLVLITAAIVTAAISLTVIIKTVVKTDAYAPLSVLAIEPVPSRVAGVDGPAIHNGEDVITTSHKCNSTGEPVNSRSIKDWEQYTPGQGFNGFDVSKSNGIQVYEPGCHDFTYSNPMPPEVETRNTELFAAGAHGVWWKLTASETPVGAKKAVVWFSELFQVVP